ncbi:thermonuclease family protein [Uruburuella testudinis]|uniref:Thermonuclease family protein n=1 Tax=Uruburuella testudinis TaxID=1282863 RepID=A0ABY4DU56_9NEIS|nr:thermonuclease family protein [Uruburuella testudinis]UOO82579.1 thermonuclease family protein [Uruburuella testudinis]
MDSSFWYGLLLAVLGFFGIQPASGESPAWLQAGMDFVREHNRQQVLVQAAGGYAARVQAVSDGDSVRVIDENGRRRRLRLAYIDAPEINQAHGKAARDALRQRLSGQTVQVTVFEQDQYGREVAQLFLNGQDINLYQLENGHAWHYVSIAKRKQSSLDYAGYAYAEAAARQQRSGLWRGRNPQAPWAFRKQARPSK